MSVTDTLNKGKALAASATQKANAAVNDYVTVPGFKDYELNSKDVLRSKKTGNIQQIPAGKKKYLIFANNGQRKSIGLDEIKELIGPRMPVSATPNTFRNDEQKPLKKKEQILALHKQGKTLDEIATELDFKKNTVYECIYKHTIGEMYGQGKSAEEISAATGYGVNSVQRQINKYFKK